MEKSTPSNLVRLTIDSGKDEILLLLASNQNKFEILPMFSGSAEILLIEISNSFKFLSSQMEFGSAINWLWLIFNVLNLINLPID